MTSPKQVAHEIVVDYRDESISIDGIRFPYYVAPDPEIEKLPDGSMGILHVGILTNNLTIIGSSGTIHRPIAAPLGADLDWARRRAMEIAIEGLAPVLQWIGRGMPR